ncbi:hypothetical protein BaRGS_00002889 [Batillaria attramentaria]|uniref:Uncharacterized protein n=1 Tax=Batillaria attramentaria TaxID=370345 RepID=A0ABD0M2L4_9CAEN
MDEKEQKLRLTLEKNLQKAFKIVQLSLVSLEATLKDSSAKVSSLVNLLEQYEICHAVDQRQIPFHNSFPDLRLRLLVKLSTDISDKQDELRRMM